MVLENQSYSPSPLPLKFFTRWLVWFLVNWVVLYEYLNLGDHSLDLVRDPLQPLHPTFLSYPLDFWGRFAVADVWGPDRKELWWSYFVSGKTKMEVGSEIRCLKHCGFRNVWILNYWQLEYGNYCFQYFRHVWLHSFFWVVKTYIFQKYFKYFFFFLPIL